MTTRRSFLSLMAAAAAWKSVAARAQERFSPFVGSKPDTVRRMVELAALRPGETVIDLGSGDGRIVFAAARAVPGLRGIGVDIDAKLVAQANQAAREQGLADRVQFFHRNAFDADISKVDVIFMWLFPELMRLLRPKIVSQARAGARVVASTWDLGAWPADAADDIGGGQPTMRKWIVPARVEGAWEWDAAIAGRAYRFSALFEQRLQQAEGVVRVGNRREVFQHVLLRGDTLQFTLRMTLPGAGYTSMAFTGRVRGDTIDGQLDAQLPREGEEEATDDYRVNWRARRTTSAGYFAYTGTDLG